MWNLQKTFYLRTIKICRFEIIDHVKSVYCIKHAYKFLLREYLGFAAVLWRLRQCISCFYCGKYHKYLIFLQCKNSKLVWCITCSVLMLNMNSLTLMRQDFLKIFSLVLFTREIIKNCVSTFHVKIFKIHFLHLL